MYARDLILVLACKTQKMTIQSERGRCPVQQTTGSMKYLFILFLLCPPLSLGDREFEDHGREERDRGGGGEGGGGNFERGGPPERGGGGGNFERGEGGGNFEGGGPDRGRGEHDRDNGDHGREEMDRNEHNNNNFNNNDNDRRKFDTENRGGGEIDVRDSQGNRGPQQQHHGGNENPHHRINFEDSEEVKNVTPDDNPGAVIRLLGVDDSTLTASQTLGVSCKDPQERDGVCSYITDPKCASLNNGLRTQNKRLKSLTLQFIDKATSAPCGYDGTDLTVCCLAHPPPKHPPHQHKSHPPPKNRYPAAKRPRPRPRPMGPHQPLNTDEVPQQQPEQQQPPPESPPISAPAPTTPPPPQKEETTETCGVRQIPTVEGAAISKREAREKYSIRHRFKRTVGGFQAPKGYFPWAAVLGQPDNSNGGFNVICGSTLLTHQHVLTAAHCFPVNASAAHKITHVRLGEQDLKGGDSSIVPIDAQICEVVIHEDFVEVTSVENDVAILTLCNPVEYSTFIQPACLPAAGTEPTGNLTIAGWGSEYYGGAPVIALNEADVVLVPLTDCQKEYEVIGGKIDNSHICAGKGKTDACAGDSGGPMLEQIHDSWTVVGITSFGVGCANEDFPGVYTNVAQFVDWITARLE